LLANSFLIFNANYREKRKRYERNHPSTPNIHEECSKRQFDGRVKAWRRMLHKWDNVDALPLDGKSPATKAGQS